MMMKDPDPERTTAAWLPPVIRLCNVVLCSVKIAHTRQNRAIMIADHHI